MNQDTHLEDDPVGLLDILQVVANNFRLLVLGPLLVGLLALGYSFTIPPTFTATTKLMPPQQQQSGASAMLAGLGALGGLAGAAGGIRNPVDQYVSFIKSRSLQDALVERFKLTDRYGVKFRDDARRALDGNLQVASGKDGMITIEVGDKDPVFAALLANAHVEELVKLLNRLAVTEAQQRRLFFEKQLSKAKENLIKAEQALKLSGMSPSVLKADPKAAVEGLSKLKAAITAQEIKLGAMRGYLTESAPEFKQAQTELSAMRANMAGADKEQNPGKGSDGDSDYVARYRDFKYYETLFELFAKQFEIARIDESREGAVIQVVDIAIAPERKSRPNKAQIAVLATLATGFFLLLIVFIRQALNAAARNPGYATRISAVKTSFKKSFGSS
jgi:tyrosine-protein kinase Etk/Wzc